MQSTASSRHTALHATPEASSPDSTRTSSKNLAGKTIYQRAFYRFSPESDLDMHNAVVIEERVRFEPDPKDPEYIKPTGPRTLILRDGQVEEGEIGDEFFVCQVHDGSKTHQGAGTDFSIQSCIATAMYLASNPSLVSGRVLEVACETGLAGLLGCIGAGYVSNKDHKKKEMTDEIMTIPHERDDLIPDALETLYLTDSDEERLNLAFKNVKNSGLSPSKVSIEELAWDKRARRRPGKPLKEFHTIIASDVAFSYPEAKELSHTVANRLEPWGASMSGMFMGSEEEKVGSPPRFVHVCPDAHEDPIHLQRLLEKGYRMSVSTGYLKLERLKFCFQTLPHNEPESALDDLDLELEESKDIYYQSLTAQHHPDYAGEGSGEIFFPMETGEFDASGGSTSMERETDTSPW